jgi:hypothetical protein
VPFRPSVLSFASVHKFALHERAVPLLRYHFASVHNLRYTVPFRPSVLSFASVHICVTKGCRSSVLSFASVHKFALHEGCRSSLLSFASVHKFALHEGAVVPRAIIRICS